MIARYTRPEMGRVWSDENKFKKWLECAMAAAGPGLEEARVRVQRHTDGGPDAWDPRRAHYVRLQAGHLVCRKPAERRAAVLRGRADAGGENFRRRRDLRPLDAGDREKDLRETRPAARARLLSNPPARPARVLFMHSGRRRSLARKNGSRGPQLAADRGAGSGGIFRARAERLFGHAAQAQPGNRGADLRPGASGKSQRPGGAGKRRALARTRYFSFLGRARHPAGFDDPPRLYAP